MPLIQKLEAQLWSIERQSCSNAADLNERAHRVAQLQREIAVLKSGHRLDHR